MLRVRLLGTLELAVGDRPVAAPAGRPARSLLAWLALHPGMQQRSRVAAELWPDVLDESARASLRTALSAVRQSLGEEAGALVSDRQAVGFAGPPAVWVDVLEFDSLLDSGLAVEALELSDGELLPDIGDDWATVARDRHRERRGRALAALADAAASAGDHERALGWARRRCELDPFDEPALRDLVERLAGAGDRAGALAAYERFAERLRRELAVAPSAATRDLVATLRSDDAAFEKAPGSPPPLPSRLDPERWRSVFVGRVDALARLGAAWARTRPGGMEFALVVGEPGIGKTRLAARFAAEAHAGGAAVLAGRAEHDSGQGYQPLAEALRAAGLAFPASADEVSSDDHAGRLRLHDSLADLLDRAAAGRPLLLVIDDVHWADAATLGFLRQLASRGSAVPLLVLATSRPGELDARRPLARLFADIGRDVSITRVSLGGLSLNEAAALVADRGGAAAEGADVDALARRTGGNPFFLEALMDAGLAGGQSDLPVGVAELVGARVDWLGSRVRAVLEAGAVLGREFDVELAAAAVELAPKEALEALDAAVAAHLLVPAAERAGRMAFVHALVQEALERMPPPGARARLHARAVEALGPRVATGSESALAAAARHALAAYPVLPAPEAADLAERAGAALMAAFAPADAAGLLAQAAALCDEAGVPLELRGRLRCALGEALQAADRPADARGALDEAARLARRAGDAELLARVALAVSRGAVAIVRVDRERVALLDEALDALPLEARDLRSLVQARLAIELAYDPDEARRQRLSADALAQAREGGDPRTLAVALGARHVVLWGPDHTRERLGLADEMVTLAQRAGDPALELQARSWRIVDLDELGEGPALEAELDAYAATAARSGLTAYGWYVPAWRCVRAGLAGDLEESSRLLRRAITLGRRAGDENAELVQLARWILDLPDDGVSEIDLEWQQEKIRTSPAGWAYHSMYTWSLAARGQWEEARRDLAGQRARGAPGSWPRDTNWISAMKEMSEVAVLLDDRELGAEVEELLEPFHDRMVTSSRALLCAGSVAGALARLAELGGESGRAIERYEEAIEREERAGALAWAARHRWLLGEALLNSGQRERGTELLARAADETASMGLTRISQKAAERLARVRV